MLYTVGYTDTYDALLDTMPFPQKLGKCNTYKGGLVFDTPENAYRYLEDRQSLVFYHVYGVQAELHDTYEDDGFRYLLRDANIVRLEKQPTSGFRRVPNAPISFGNIFRRLIGWFEQDLDVPERITRVACRLQYGKFQYVWHKPPPNRHGDILKVIYRIFPFKNLAGLVYDHHQGFLTNYGRFVDREEAREIAEDQNQLLERAYAGNRLYSEDVW